MTDAPASSITMNDNNTDWNPLYPFSSVPYSQFSLRHCGLILMPLQFLSPYKVDLPSDPSFVPPSPPQEQFIISAVNSTVDEAAGTRSFTLKVQHSGIIWTGKRRSLFTYSLACAKSNCTSHRLRCPCVEMDLGRQSAR
jgi:hypothetical protein